MIGLIFLFIFGGIFVIYSIVTYRSVHAIYLKTNSKVMAFLTIVVFILIPTADTIFNRWYHGSILCKRDDIGLSIFNPQKLPASYYDTNDKFKSPNGWGRDGAKIENRFEYREGVVTGGNFPFTGFEQRYSGVFDHVRKEYISYETEIFNRGSGWWLVPLNKIFTQFTYNGSPIYFGNGERCSDIRTSTNLSVAAQNGVFEERRKLNE